MQDEFLWSKPFHKRQTFQAYPSRFALLNHNTNGQKPKCRYGGDSFDNLTTADWTICISVCVQSQPFGQLEYCGKYEASCVSILSLWSCQELFFVSPQHTALALLSMEGADALNTTRSTSAFRQLEELSLKRLLVMS